LHGLGDDHLLNRVRGDDVDRDARHDRLRARHADWAEHGAERTGSDHHA
jgi:hypothetical protein